MLADLQNSVATGVLLVAVIILFALGFRASLFIGIAIPASFLAGVLGLQLAGLTVNIVVLFSLILAVGMLVDDAIIVSEFAERRMSEGMPPREAYSLAAKRMSGPVIAATATRVAAFSPLLFWPGVVGEFMKYLPITLIATLSASLVVALIFTPTLGALLGKAAPVPHDERVADRGPYMRTVRLALRRPGTTLALAAFLLVAVQVAYGKFGRGVEFFPKVEPDYGQVIVHARGNLSLDEKNRLVGEVEKRVLGVRRASRPSTRASASSRAARAKSPRTRSASSSSSSPTGRRGAPAHEIMDEIREKTADIPGILVEVTAPRAGPPTGKPVQVQLARARSGRPAGRRQEGRGAARAAHATSATSTTACRFPASTGRSRSTRRRPRNTAPASTPSASAVQLVTNGLKVDRIPAGRESTRRSTSWCASRPTSAASTRSTSCASRPRPATCRSAISSSASPAPRVGYINRVAGNRVMTVVVQRRRRRAERQGAAGDRRRARQDRSRAGRDVAPQGRGRGAREGVGVPAQGVRHRDLPDLRDPAGAVQPADLGRAGAHRGGALDHRRAARPA